MKQTLPSRTALTDGGRFDLREGYDLERLLWPEAGNGGSTGLLENFAVGGRHPSTDDFTKSTALGIVKQGRSSSVRLQDDRATPRTATAGLRYIVF